MQCAAEGFFHSRVVYTFGTRNGSGGSMSLNVLKLFKIDALDVHSVLLDCKVIFADDIHQNVPELSDCEWLGEKMCDAEGLDVLLIARGGFAGDKDNWRTIEGAVFSQHHGQLIPGHTG